MFIRNVKKRLCDSLLLIYACTPPTSTSPENQAMLLSHNALDIAQSHSLAKLFQGTELKSNSGYHRGPACAGTFHFENIVIASIT